MSQTQQLWQELATAALIGSERNNVQLPTAESSLGSFLAQFDSSDREGYLLGTAAVIALYNRAGTLPPEYKQPLPSVAEKEEKPRCNSQAASHLAQIMSGHFREVLPEWLRIAAETNQRVPEELLPDLLEIARTQNDLRELIWPVLGQRGYWLATQNPNWEFGVKATDIETSWQTGNRAVRLQVLKQLRASEPARASAMLESTWAAEKPEDRAALLETFSINHSLADEPFLERALDDKRKEVRTIAANLLAHLPESRLVQRMIERVKPLLNWKYEAKNKKAEIEVTLPQTCDKAMLRDGIEAKPPQYSNKGEKTWWLEQMLGVIPPSVWIDYWTTTPENLVTVFSKNSEWSKILLNALAAAAHNNQDSAMSAALLKLASRHISDNLVTQLITFLPYSDQEEMLFPLLEGVSSPSYALLINLVTNTKNWSEKLGRAFLRYVHYYILGFDKGFSYENQNLLKQAMCAMPPALIAEVDTFWPKDAKYWKNQSNTAKELMTLLQFRADMLNALRA